MGSTPQEHIFYEDCIVSFIDILGFKEFLQNSSAQAVYDVMDKLKRSTKPVDTLEPRSSDEFRLYSIVYAHSISDAVVRVRPYQTQQRDGAFRAEIYDLMLSQVDLVSQGIFIRAGLSVGKAYVGLGGEGPVFGPAMAKAYDIESNVAIFPRVVVDDHALLEFRKDEQLRSEYASYEEEKEWLDKVLIKGEDGSRYVDYVRGCRSEMEMVSGYLDFLNTHAENIFRYSSNAKDERVKRKYEWLKIYHNTCVKELFEEVDDLEQKVIFEGVEEPVNMEDYLRKLLIPENT